MKKVLSLVLAVLMAAAAMTACTTLEKNELGEYDKGAIIDMYLTTEVYDFDPQQSITDDAMLKIMSLLYEPLTRLNEKGKWEKAGMKNYTVDVDDGEDFIILIELNDTRWSDGRTVQAADYVYSWKRLLEAENPNEAASLLFDIKNAYDIKLGDASIDDLGIAAVDTYTLQVQFEKKIDLDRFFENCSSIALSPLREDVITHYKDSWACKSTYIVTNGPFCPKEIEYGKTLRLERSSYYYLPKNYKGAWDKYVIPYRLLTRYSTGDADDQVKAYEDGAIFYNGEIALDKRADYAKSATVTDLMTTHTYVFNTKNELFEKPEVRRALSMALDRNAIVELITFAKPATGYIPYKVFDTKAGTSFRKVGGDLLSAGADLEGAKALLKQAGSKGGSFTLTVRDNEVDKAIADYAAGVWSGLGFKVDVDVVKANAGSDSTIYVDNFQDKYDAGDFDVIAIDMNMLSPDAFGALSQFAVSFSGNGVDMNSENYELYGHITGYADDDYNALIESAFAETDRSARATILHDAEKKLLDDMPVIPLVFLQDAYLDSDELSGIKSTYYGTRDFADTKLKNYMSYKALTDTEEE